MNDNKATLVWALYFAGILIFFAPLIGVIFAYMWKSTSNSETRAELRTQIKVFWRCAQIWAVALVLMIVAIATDGGTGAPILFLLGLLVAFVAQIWFLGRSAYGLAKSLRDGQPNFATA